MLVLAEVAASPTSTVRYLSSDVAQVQESLDDTDGDKGVLDPAVFPISTSTQHAIPTEGLDDLPNE